MNIIMKSPPMKKLEKTLDLIQSHQSKANEELTKALNEMRDIKKEINLLRIEFMVIKSDSLKDKEFEKIKSSEATSDSFTRQEEVNKDNIAKGFWWS